MTRMHGTEALINTDDQDEITDPAVCYLRHLTSHHVHAEMAQHAVRTRNGITALANILKSPIAHWPLLKV